MSQTTVPSAHRAGYALDQTWHAERARLDSMTALFDPGTLRICDKIGVTAGWQCCDVGAGTGSIVRHLAERVGPTGRVLAVDANTRFLDPIATDRIEVLRADVTSDPLPAGHFDLVHARLLLEHLPSRDAVLASLAESVRPGGWLLIEDFDWVTAYVIDPPSPVHDRVVDAVLTFLGSAGYDSGYGRRLPNSLRGLGLVDVTTSAESIQVGPDPVNGVPQWELLVEQLGSALLAQGLLLPENLAEFITLWHDGVTGCFSPLMVSCWGRRPAA